MLENLVQFVGDDLVYV